MAVHSIKAVQKIPVSVEEAWSFFSNPANLQLITPAYMKFRIISENLPDSIYAGQLIEYRVSPVAGIPLYWLSEITFVKKNECFIDEQRKGPYQFWKHVHQFRAIGGGVEMTDRVQYKNPFGWLGKVSNKLFVKSRLEKIFHYRFKKVEEIFGRWNGQTTHIEII